VKICLKFWIGKKEQELPINGVVQEYLESPSLISGQKFDLRLYVLIQSCDPLSVYLFKDGLVRICTEKYQKPSLDNLKNLNMHLTNYTVNKTSDNFFVSKENEDKFEDYGSKRSFAGLLEWLEHDRGKDIVDILLNDLFDLIAKTVIAVQPTLSSLNKSSFPAKTGGFELLGFDVMLDEALKPWIMEVNQSPSLSIDLPIDLKVKQKLIEETLRLMIDKNGERDHFWNVYPGRDHTRFTRLFCFPFPEELFNGNFLDLSSLSNLMSAVRK